MDWQTWHDDYDDPTSTLSRRLRAVQGQIVAFLDAAPPGPISVLSLCAGQARDILGVLPTHPRRHDVHTRLVELDPGNTAIATETAHGLTTEIITGDAGNTTNATQSDLVLLCGIFGNIPDADIKRTIDLAPQLTTNTIIWTRTRRRPDLVPTICAWFEQHHFTRTWLSSPTEDFGIGVHRLTTPPQPLQPDQHLFTFTR
ncbi:SAM-dependent methyltransferase [Actinokineospora cianjurensis]|uniref:Methyltransferase n=1 Tax=Actinokineospora cianjurensis TaxID=585224 RepID=A0A421AXR3_9PSEU|nr:SAM-dependent methyltransferase [Actinokineospora cianjurensis]RLK54594.1 hypothetical protein CLV68_5627 [Actinokineospora cianjurensis]